MDGPRDYHIKHSKSDRKRQVSYDITYMGNLRGRKLIYGYQSRKGEWRNKLGIWDQQIKTTMCKIDKHFHISMLWDNPEGLGEEGSGRGIQDGEDTIPVADSC